MVVATQLFHALLDTDIGYTILIAGMTQVIQFRPFGWKRRRTLIAPPNPPDLTNSRYFEPSRSFRALSRVPRMRFLLWHLHQLASTCTNLQEKKLRAKLQAVAERAARNSHFNRPHSDLPGANRSYRDLSGPKKCKNRLYPRYPRNPRSLSSASLLCNLCNSCNPISFLVLLGVIWCSLVLFGPKIYF